MKLIYRWDGSNQHRADRAEQRRRQSPHPRDVRSHTGTPFHLEAGPRGYPSGDGYFAGAAWLPYALGVALEVIRYSRHRWKFAKSWQVIVTKLDDRGFRTSDRRCVVVASRAAATEALAAIGELVERDGITALDTMVASGQWRPC